MHAKIRSNLKPILFITLFVNTTGPHISEVAIQVALFADDVVSYHKLYCSMPAL